MYTAERSFVYGPEKNTRCTCLSRIILLASWNSRWNSITTFVNRKKKNCSKYTVRKPVYSKHIGVISKSHPLSCLEATASTKLMAFSILIGHNLRRLQDRATVHSKTRHTTCY